MSDPDPDVRQLAMRRFTVLRQQHAKLHVERDHMVVNVKRNIMAGFHRQLGAHDHAFKKAEWEVARLKRELELVKGAEKEGEVDYERISGVLDAEFEPRAHELEAAPRQMEWANRRLSTLMNHEQSAAFQARYRRLAERLHPDLRLEQGGMVGNLWDRARECYAAGDAAELEAIELLAEDLPAEAVETSPLEDINRRVDALKHANGRIINEIATLRREWPFPLIDKLPDEKWLSAQRAEYAQKTARLIAEREALAEELNRVLDLRPPDKQ